MNVDIEALKKLVACLEFKIMNGVSMKIEEIECADDGRQLYRLELIYREYNVEDLPASDDL